MEARFCFLKIVLLINILVIGDSVTVSKQQGAPPVKLSVYFESLSTTSKTFYVDQLYPVWSDLKDIMEMDINFYGRIVETQLGEGYEFFCENGPSECDGNMMMGCAKHLWSEEKYLEFGNCIMTTFISTEAGSVCASYIMEDYRPVENCWNSLEGQLLLHEIGERQRQLHPLPSYIPWIIVNDVFSQDTLDAAQKDLRRVICEAYEGLKPEACYL
ncbi:gamma-interferon-inducible lysosomal thiol reductase-like isoform X1 [Palaemon carinicauda]|uniref:gamma-interferon-inducible lysosomal thiol reductase-like isoform X1 n=1 Tax=Palaemon carinicauda TaxID=392227 RepID=UPI0035B5F819